MGSNKNKKNRNNSSKSIVSKKDNKDLKKEKETSKVESTKDNLKETSKNLSSSDNIDKNIQFSVDSNKDPFAIGQNLIVKYRDGSHRLAKIIERSLSADKNVYKYYIHYYDFNRRMDEWVDNDRIVESPPMDYPLEILKRTSSHSSISSNISEDNDSTDNTDSILNNDISANNKTTSVLTTIAELEHDEHEGLDEASLLEHEEVTKVKNIKYVQLGKHIMECWYFSPFPKEYHLDGPIECIYICEYTFRFFKTKDELIRYLNKPNLLRHPPGNEIYRDNHLAMFELDGAVEKTYCQNLCYFAKLFLDHKTLYWDIDPFLFYVLCTYDSRGYHPVGFFSKEKYSDMGYNLACILTFPCAQRKGYGKFLISFSYELSKKEEKVGSPEKPLSDLGAVSYRSYWASVILRYLRDTNLQNVSIIDISKATSILSDDIVSTLQFLGLLQYSNHSYFIYAPTILLDKLIEKYPISGHSVDPDRLHWTPLYVTDPRKDKWSIKAKKETINHGLNIPQITSTISNEITNKLIEI